MKRSFIPPEHRPVIKGSQLKKESKTQSEKESGTEDAEDVNARPIKKATYLYFGPQDDEQFTLFIRNKQGLIYYFEDFNKKWNFSYSNREAFIYDQRKKTNFRITLFTKIYVRYPVSAQNSWLDFFRTLELCHYKNSLGNPDSQFIFLNKATQLKYFGNLAPHSLITNKREILTQHGTWICKSLSSLRSKAAFVSYFLKEKEKISLPVFLQERVVGEEHKAHFNFHNEKKVLMDLAIISEEIDYRHGNTPAIFKPYSKTPQQLWEIARKLHQKLNLSLFDIDYFEDENRNVTILEVNGSPAFSYLAHKSFQKDKIGNSLTPHKSVIVLGCKNDYTFHYFKTISENLKKKKDEIHYLYYEDIFKKWSYYYEQDKFIFKIDNKKVLPSALYHRGVMIEGVADWNHPLILIQTIFNFSNMKVVTRPYDQFRNTSKPFQQITTLQSIQTPFTSIIKKYKTSLPKKSVVKSISSVRSIVVDENIYKQWNAEALSHLPVQFQEKIDGKNIRVHVVDDEVFAHEVHIQGGVDYRYNKPQYTPIQLPQSVIEVCQELRQRENNLLVGIDLIYKNKKYYCLEVNPSPGWGHFHDKNHDVTFEIGKKLQEVLHA